MLPNELRSCNKIIQVDNSSTILTDPVGKLFTLYDPIENHRPRVIARKF